MRRMLVFDAEMVGWDCWYKGNTQNCGRGGDIQKNDLRSNRMCITSTNRCTLDLVVVRQGAWTMSSCMICAHVSEVRSPLV